MSWLLSPLSSAYSCGMDIRNRLYDRGVLKTTHFDVPIVSVGNMTMGGAGKTPIICELIHWAHSQGLKPGIISRGYRGQVSGVAKVSGQNPDPIQFGDEPAMMSLKFPNVPIYVGAERIHVVNEMLKNEKVNIIFADDAFQHRRLGRKLDIVVIDATEELRNYRVIPVGRAREDEKGLLRSHFIILNKVNLVEPQVKNDCLTYIDSILSGKDIPVIESEYYVKGFRRLDDKEYVEAPRFEPVYLVSGIGNPSGFEKMILNNFDVRGHIRFRDHHIYDEQDVRKILKEAAQKGANRILCTEKDAVKLRAFSEAQTKIWCAELSVKLSLRIRQLYDRLSQLTTQTI